MGSLCTKTDAEAIEFLKDKAAVFEQTGREALKIKNYSIAIRYFKKALEAQKKVIATNDIRKIETCINLASAYEALLHYTDALTFYQKALRKSSRAGYKRKMPDLYQSIAKIYQNNRQYEKALNAYQEGIKVAKSVFGEHSVMVGSMALQMGKIHIKFEMYEKAAQSLKLTLAVCLKKYPESDKTVSDCYILLGRVHKKQKMWKDARLYYIKALEGTQKRVSENDQELALLNYNIGMLYKEEKLFEDSLTYMEKCLQIEINNFGLRHQRVEVTMQTVKRIAQMISRDTDSILEPFESYFEAPEQQQVVKLEKTWKRSGRPELCSLATMDSFSDDLPNDKGNFDEILTSITELASEVYSP